MIKQTNKTIAIFSSYIPPHVGGVEKYTINLANQLVKKNYHVLIITCNYESSLPFEEQANITIIRLPIYKLFMKRFPLIKFNKEYRKLMNKLTSYNIEHIIINTRFYILSLVGTTYGYKHNINTYVIEHGSNYVTLNNKFLNFCANRYEDLITSYIKPRVSGFYGVSNESGLWLSNFNIKAKGTWYNAINDDLGEITKTPHTGINFLYVGRIIEQKGIEDILISYTKLKQEYPHINLYLAGDGEKLNYYKEKYQDKSIHFLGRINYQELITYYKKTDIFLFPVKHPEGFPTALLEAGITKCAVITTNLGGIKEIIKNRKNGLIIEAGVDSLTLAMKELIESPETRYKYSESLEKTVKKNFTWDIVGKKICHDLKNATTELQKPGVLHLLASNKYSGAEKVACTIIKNSSNYRMYYASPKGSICQKLSEENITHIHVNIFNIFKIRKIIKRLNISIIHAHDYKASFVSALANQNVKIISMLHVNYDFSKTWNIYTKTYNKCIEKFSKIITVSPEVYREAIFINNDNWRKFKVLNNVIESKEVINKSNEFITPTYDLCFFARLEEVKRPTMFIDIVKELKEEHPNIKACMIGDGKLKKKCQKLIEKYHLEENIDLLGFKSNPFPYIKNSQVMLLPSTHEGLPLVVIETLILETPVLHGGVGGLLTLYKKYPKYMCSEVSSYVKRVNEILKKGKTPYQKDCQRIIKNYINISSYIEKLEKIYTEVLNSDLSKKNNI